MGPVGRCAMIDTGDAIVTRLPRPSTMASQPSRGAVSAARSKAREFGEIGTHGDEVCQGWAWNHSTVLYVPVIGHRSAAGGDGRFPGRMS